MPDSVKLSLSSLSLRRLVCGVRSVIEVVEAKREALFINLGVSLPYACGSFRCLCRVQDIWGEEGMLVVKLNGSLLDPYVHFCESSDAQYQALWLMYTA